MWTQRTGINTIAILEYAIRIVFCMAYTFTYTCTCTRIPYPTCRHPCIAYMEGAVGVGCAVAGTEVLGLARVDKMIS